MNPTFLAYFHIKIPMLCFVDRLKNGAVMHLKFKKANCRMICLCPINCSSSKSEKKKVILYVCTGFSTHSLGIFRVNQFLRSVRKHAAG